MRAAWQTCVGGEHCDQGHLLPPSLPLHFVPSSEGTKLLGRRAKPAGPRVTGIKGSKGREGSHFSLSHS